MVFVVFIVAIIIIGFVVKKIWDCCIKKDEEKTTSDYLIQGGTDVILASLPTFSDSFLQLLYDFFQVPKTATDDGPSLWWLIVIGFILIAIGVILIIVDASAKYVVLNMPGTIHHTIEDGMIKALKTKKYEEIEISTAKSQEEMQRISQAQANKVLDDIERQMGRFNSQTRCRRCFTGMAPIPFIIYAGTKHKGNDIKYYLEFNKATQQYLKLKNDKSFPKLHKPAVDTVDADEIVVAVSTTARITESNIKQFGKPVYCLSLDETKDNAVFSKRQLDDYVNETVTFISGMCTKNSNIVRVDLILATQACFAYAFGKTLVLMQNRVPQIVSYHYVAPSYKVGLIINGNSAGQIVKVKDRKDV